MPVNTANSQLTQYLLEELQLHVCSCELIHIQNLARILSSLRSNHCSACVTVYTDLIFSVDDVSRPIVAAHDAHVTVLPGQLKSVGDLVHVRLEERQDAAESTGSMSTLIVVIVDKYECIECIQLPPTFTEVAEVGQLLSIVLAHHVAEMFAVSEFSHSTDVSVFVVADCFPAQINHL
jgi:hypothetical protein